MKESLDFENEYRKNAVNVKNRQFMVENRRVGGKENNIL